MNVDLAIQISGIAFLFWCTGYGLGISLRAVRQLIEWTKFSLNFSGDNKMKFLSKSKQVLFGALSSLGLMMV